MQRNIAQYNNKIQYNIKHAYCIALHYTLQGRDDEINGVLHRQWVN